MQKSSYSLGLTFAGSALQNHAACVKDLAPALLALSTAVKSLNRLINGDGAKVDLTINACTGGSFGFELTLAPDFLTQVSEFFSGDRATSGFNAKTLFDCLIEILILKKWLQGRRDAEFKAAPDAATVSVTVENQTLVINWFTYLGFQDQACNESCSRLAEPLHQPGFDKLTVSTAEKLFELDASEADGFEASEALTVLTENTIPAVVQVESTSFKVGKQLRVLLGERNSIVVTIDDPDFNAKIHQGSERFGKGDLLKVDLHSRQVMLGGRITIEYAITKVHEHKEKPYQGKLF